MKNIKLIIIVSLLFGCKNNKDINISNDLIIIEQDYDKALKTAKKENKLLFIDFYTVWCKPCKEMDKLVFQNKSIQKKLSENFIFLKYNAENDSVYNLSKKHHVNSYPTAIILNSQGYVLNRKYGFSGENFRQLSKNLLDFSKNGIELNDNNKFLKGYSNTIDISKYPKFYIDYVNRDQVKISISKEFKKYLNKKPNILSEEFFSTLIYFAQDIPIELSNKLLELKDKYIHLYGNTDVETSLYILCFSKFQSAIIKKDKKMFYNSKEFATKALGKKSNEIISLFEKKLETSK